MPFQRHLFVGLWGLLCALAWSVLWLGHRAEWGHALHLPSWTIAGEHAMQRASSGWLLPFALYLTGWLLMSAAMMLPTVLPLISKFHAMVRPRPDGATLVAMLVFGYISAWMSFGVAAFGLDRAVRLAVGRIDWLAANGWLIGAAVLAVAGLFQFSSLKDFCLERCRAPLGFVLRHWHGPRPRREALAVGIDHGVFCVGCCWALMLLMFLTGTANLAWMLMLAAVMAAEKNLPGGYHLSRPIGALLLMTAAATLLFV